MGQKNGPDATRVSHCANEAPRLSIGVGVGVGEEGGGGGGGGGGCRAMQIEPMGNDDEIMSHRRLGVAAHRFLFGFQRCH